MAEALTLYKLIILYMLERVDFPLTTSQISEFVLGKNYTNYFKLQSALSEMIESNLITMETTRNRTLYHLTDLGHETLTYFRDRISKDIQNDIDTYLKEKKYDLKEEISVKTEYYLTTSHEYEVRLQIIEDGLSLIDLRLLVPTETEAETIASNWTKSSSEIYPLLLSKLL